MHNRRLPRLLMVAALILAPLALGAAFSFAQTPPPVPALPDTERRTQYSPSASIGPFNVGFALYGDSTDYGDWIEVWLNGSKLTAVTAWTLSSPTGPIATIPRPITDAQITLISAATGTLQIVGARRPRRLTQLQENRGVAARDFNQTFTDQVAVTRETWDAMQRSLIGLPGETIARLPAAATRAGQLLGFDGSGNPIAYVPGSISPSAITCSSQSFVTAITSGGVPSCVTIFAASGGGSTNFLRADGTWAVPANASTAANPAGTVGLVAVNGASTSYMRADGAPPLSQAITPTWTGRHIFNYSPAFDLATNLLSVNTLFEATNVTVPANSFYSDIRASQTSGANNTFTVGAGGAVSGIFENPESLAGSSATSNVYGAILHCQNDGPGTCKGVHAEADGSGTSSGAIVAVNAQVNPVATTSTGSAAVQIALTGGLNDIAGGINFTTGAGERYAFGIGSSIAPVSINSAFYQAWMATGSAAGARAFQVKNNAGGEIGGIDKLGDYFGPAITLNGSASGSINVVPPAAAGANTLTLPAATDTLVGKATTDTLTNKTLTAPVISTIANTGTLTLPTSTDTLVGKATTDTLTNKTYDTGGTGNVFKIAGAAAGTVAQVQAAIGYPWYTVSLDAVNLNSANTDNAITISCPTTRCAFQQVALSGCTASASTATIGLFGTTGASNPLVGLTAITVTTAAENTLNNYQAIAITNNISFTQATLQVRVGTAQGSPVTCNVDVVVKPLP